MNRSLQAFAFTVILLGLTATRARADLNITVGDATVASGQTTGTIDITATTIDGFTLSSFGLELQINEGSNSAFPQFSSAQPNAPFSNTPYPYVFASGSFAADNSLPFWSDPSNTPPFDGSTIIGGDSSDSSQGYVSVPGGTTELLAAVQFSAAAPGTYQVSLVSDSSFTYFDDQYGTAMNFGPAAVPEPSSLTIVALSGLSGLLWWYLRGRKHAQSKDSPLRERKKVDIAL